MVTWLLGALLSLWLFLPRRLWKMARRTMCKRVELEGKVDRCYCAM